MRREKGEIKFWFTTKTGRHIPVFEGETKADVVKRLKEKTSKSERKSMKETAQKVKAKKKESDRPKEKDYHVEHTDEYGGKYVDKGKVGKHSIGDNVKYKSYDKKKSGTINKAHIYPNGKVDYNVVDKDGDGHLVSSDSISRKKAPEIKKKERKLVTASSETKRKAQADILKENGVDREKALSEIQNRLGISREKAESKMDSMSVQQIKNLANSSSKDKKSADIEKAQERAKKLNQEEAHRDALKKDNTITKKNGKMHFKDKEVPELDTKDAGYINVTNDKGEVYDKVKDSLSKHLENGKLSKEREKVHAQIIEDYFKDKTPLAPGQKKVAYFTGGGGASGKGQFSGDNGKNVEKFYSENNNPLIIDPDAIKSKLAEADKKTLDAWLTGYYHEESSALAKQIYATALQHGYPVMYDGTATGGGIFKLLEAAKQSGYSTEMNFLFSDWNTVRMNSLARYEKTGRFVPPEQVFGAHQKAFGSVEKLKDVVDDFTLWDNAGRKMRKVAEGGKGKKFKMLNQQSYDRFSKSRAEFTLSDEAIDAYMDEADKITAMLEKKIKAGK